MTKLSEHPLPTYRPMVPEQHDAHVVAWRSWNLRREGEALMKIAEALEGMNSDQARRALGAVCGYYGMPDEVAAMFS